MIFANLISSDFTFKVIIFAYFWIKNSFEVIIFLDVLFKVILLAYFGFKVDLNYWFPLIFCLKEWFLLRSA